MKEDPEEERLKKEIEKEKERYKNDFQRLKQLKHEIEHMQHLMEKGKVRLQSDFEAWLASKRKETSVKSSLSSKINHGHQGSSVKSRDSSSWGIDSQSSSNILQESENTSFTSTEESKINSQDMPMLTGNLLITIIFFSSSIEALTYSSLSPGNEEADRNIMAFYEAKKLLQKRRFDKKS
jgi:hypothetical protein